MMTLITGTPGAGKTLNTIKDVHQEVLKTPYFEKKGEDGIVEKYKREVYCCNVNGIDTEKSGFKILEDPRQWTTLPAGSILIIDEASDFYPTSKKIW
ncbi:zonular occludens toxin domain-containing protein [Vibrio aestuarianus]|uniref:zonular occludens toxin domain-containing protein n=1 Tax=Vibrio aestuarianus TaxID=28171 RepID=UPI002480DD1E|nr:zonular occludens toxin domain-containing protein [Vibrio aestuarianus]